MVFYDHFPIYRNYFPICQNQVCFVNTRVLSVRSLPGCVAKVTLSPLYSTSLLNTGNFFDVQKCKLKSGRSKGQGTTRKESMVQAGVLLWKAKSWRRKKCPQQRKPVVMISNQGKLQWTPCIGISDIFTVFTVILSMCATRKSLWQLVFLSSGKMVASSSLLCLHRVLCIFHSRYVCWGEIC